jgi:NADP-dependent aldehyde dehydrogenase
VLEQPDVVLSECFGPVTLLVEYDGSPDLVAAAAVLPGALTGTVHADEADIPELGSVLACLRDRVGRLIFDGWPTGVAVTWSMQHGGPWPSTTNAMFTSVGATALRRFLRPLTFQNAPPAILPAALLDTNPWRVPRRIDRAYHAAP